MAQPQIADHIPMLHKLAWQYARRYQMDHAELVGQGQLIFVECLGNYKPDKGMLFSSWLYRQLCQGLKKYVQKEIKTQTTAAEYMLANLQTDNELDPAKLVEFYQTISKLSAMGQRIVRIVLEDVSAPDGPRRRTKYPAPSAQEVQRRVYARMREIPQYRVRQAMREIRASF